ncbi:MAG: VTT domain-containing protein [Kiloniellaceae bacterium]
MTAYIQIVTEFITQHPHLAGALVFLTAAAEAVAVVGSLVPGTTILVGVGAIIGLGHLPLWPILIWATLGAITGDGLSYWLGHNYGNHILRIWPFSRRPELLAQGEAFFRRHGAKSVVIGRFLPVTRAVVPLVAGVLKMNPVTFYIANVLSAVVWAPVHILPGVVFGGALSVVGVVSGRLVVVLVGVLFLALIVTWLLRVALLRVIPLFERCQAWAVAWARTRHGLVPRLVAGVLDPSDPGARTVLAFGIVGAVCAIGFLEILRGILTKQSLVQADSAISNLLQGFRTTWADHTMVGITMLGDSTVTVAVAVATIGWLAWRRLWRVAASFALTLALAALSVAVFKTLLHMPRPIEIFSGSEAFGFPSGHAAMAATLYGMLAWLISASLSGAWRVVPLIFAGSFVGVIAASRIYLAAHWPTDVAAGILLGFGFAAIFGLVHRHTQSRWPHQVGLIPVVLAVLLSVGGWHIWHAFDVNLDIYARRSHVTAIAKQDWLDGGWKNLPRRRIDLDGEREEPLVLQWVGSAEQLRQRMLAAGWSAPVVWSLRSSMSFASSAGDTITLPVLPLLHDGHAAELTLALMQSNPSARQVLRAWPSEYSVDAGDGRHPVLLISVVSERIVHPWNLASLPVISQIATSEAQKVFTSVLSANDTIKSNGPVVGLLPNADHFIAVRAATTRPQR